MRYTQEHARILGMSKMAPGIWNCTVSAPRMASAAAAGQFVGILCGEYLLRRPISLCGFDPTLGVLRLVFEVRGKGTAWLADRQRGETLDLIGPLGHGFPLLEPSQKAVLVGGGIGTPPLLPLARHYGTNAVVIAGFRSSSAAILGDDFTAAGARVLLCTDDGSAGYHGFTTQVLEEQLSSHSGDVVYTCGPRPMMKRVAELAAACGSDCYVSLEERMGCGVGACIGCACMIREESGEERMQRVCLNGPVFPAKEVVWE
ncbi:MAG: dihydroorotate dehydrogenase electron transfer subunit [Clostridiales bacterium]|nr:dihydroorotate dehydrogenase electron transfer subunit [Clostridiales bacterium]